jgi:hypothetical protein
MPTQETKPEAGTETTSTEPELFVQGGFGSNGALVPKEDLKSQIEGDKS